MIIRRQLQAERQLEGSQRAIGQNLNDSKCKVRRQLEDSQRIVSGQLVERQSTVRGQLETLQFEDS